MAPRASVSSLTASGCRNSRIICRISVSTISFSKDATRPPSIQPAPCFTRFACPVTAPQIDISDSYAACIAARPPPGDGHAL
jgi:hypothetical protein